MKKWKCWVWGHAWIKRGGTRVRGGLHRECPRCGARETGFETGNSHARWIEWVRAKGHNTQLNSPTAPGAED